jgi:UDP-2-acetamido-3-amino-2,3-dideoxy-glucuronate N-acetyltransferase
MGRKGCEYSGYSMLRNVLSPAAMRGVGTISAPSFTRAATWTTEWRSGSRIGQNCKIGQNVVIGPNAVIGSSVKVQNNVSVYEGVTLEDHVFCGPSMVFTNVFNPRCEIPRMKELRPTLVRRGATIGANATIVCGNTIGSYAFIGAGAVVTKDVSDYALMAGNPAKQLGWVCRCGAKLPVRRGVIICSACGNTYKLAKGKMTAVKENQ